MFILQIIGIFIIIIVTAVAGCLYVNASRLQNEIESESQDQEAE